MLDTDPTATVDDLEHDLADLDEVELPLEQHPNGGAATIAEDEAATAISVALAPPVDEPTEVGDLDAVALDGLGAFPLPAPPLPFLKRKVYGRYRSPARRTRSSCASTSTAPRRRCGSAPTTSPSPAPPSRTSARCAWTRPAVAITATHVVISGLGRYTWAAGAPARQGDDPARPVHVGPGRRDDAAPAPERSPGATYICRYLGPAFRTVLFEQDCQDTVPSPFASYNTGSLPSGGPARTLSAVTAYARRACSCSRPARTTSSRRRRPAQPGATPSCTRR